LTALIAVIVVGVNMSEARGDPVNHPTHYTSDASGVECIEFVELLPFNVGNAVKYIWRRDHKRSAKTDLEKALWYLKRELAFRKRMLHSDSDSRRYEHDRGTLAYRVLASSEDELLSETVMALSGDVVTDKIEFVLLLVKSALAELGHSGSNAQGEGQ
jgi:hypothetical protein